MYVALLFSPVPFTGCLRAYRFHFTSLHFTSLHLTSPHLTSPHLTSPHLTSPHLTSLHFTSLHLTSLHFIERRRFQPTFSCSIYRHHFQICKISCHGSCQQFPPGAPSTHRVVRLKWISNLSISARRMHRGTWCRDRM